MKHRAIARERNEAAKEGRLPEWYAKRAAEAPAAPPTPVPDFAIQTLESTEWGDRYPRFLLATNSGSSGRPTPPRNF
jgi:hypothetical protein